MVIGKLFKICVENMGYELSSLINGYVNEVPLLPTDFLTPMCSIPVTLV